MKSVDKVLAQMGSSKATKRAYNEPLTTEQTKQIPGELIAASEVGGIWAAVQELNGYMFMELIVLDTTKIKTFKGATLKFLGELKSDFSDTFNRWVTQISVEVTKKDLNYIKKKKYTQVQLNVKKKSMLFDVKK